MRSHLPGQALGRRRLLSSAAATGLVGWWTAACDGADPGPAETTPTATTSASAAAPLTPIGSTAAGSPYVLHTDRSYATPVGRAHLLDLYVPTTGPRPFAVVVLINGSGFLSDDSKTGGGALPTEVVGGDPTVTGPGGHTTAATPAAMWAAHGYAIAAVNVESRAEAHFPAHVYDVRAAIRYLRANAAEYGPDVDRFAAWATAAVAG